MTQQLLRSIKSILKENKDTSKDLSGTEFTVKYYNKIYEKESDLPEKATKTWVIKAIKRTVGGKDIYRAQLSETCKVKGDDFYLDANGSPILPLGTITIEETSAVKGYNKDNNFTNGDVSVKGKFFGTIQKKGDAVVLHYGDTVIAEDGFTASDNIIRGDLHFCILEDYSFLPLQFHICVLPEKYIKLKPSSQILSAHNL